MELYKGLLFHNRYLLVSALGDGASAEVWKARDTKANNLTLYPGREREFWIWCASWGLFLQKPSDLGFSDEGYSLPPLDPEAMAQVDDIVAAHVSWKEDLDSRFPSLADRGRPLRSRDDRPGWVSMETYLRAELRTYSPKTIALYHRATMERLRKGESEAEQNLLHQVQQYGFEDIESAEKHFSARR